MYNMFVRINTSVAASYQRVKAVTVKAKVKSSSGPWKIADVQFQEGSVVTSYTEHVAEMRRSKEVT